MKFHLLLSKCFLLYVLGTSLTGVLSTPSSFGIASPHGTGWSVAFGNNPFRGGDGFDEDLFEYLNRDMLDYNELKYYSSYVGYAGSWYAGGVKIAVLDSGVSKTLAAEVKQKYGVSVEFYSVDKDTGPQKVGGDWSKSGNNNNYVNQIHGSEIVWLISQLAPGVTIQVFDIWDETHPASDGVINARLKQVLKYLLQKEHRVDLVSMSFGLTTKDKKGNTVGLYDKEVQQYIKYLFYGDYNRDGQSEAPGTLFIASTGNLDREFYYYPAGYAYVLGVGAIFDDVDGRTTNGTAISYHGMRVTNPKSAKYVGDKYEWGSTYSHYLASDLGQPITKDKAEQLGLTYSELLNLYVDYVLPGFDVEVRHPDETGQLQSYVVGGTSFSAALLTGVLAAIKSYYIGYVTYSLLQYNISLTDAKPPYNMDGLLINYFLAASTSGVVQSSSAHLAVAPTGSQPIRSTPTVTLDEVRIGTPSENITELKVDMHQIFKWSLYYDDRSNIMGKIDKLAFKNPNDWDEYGIGCVNLYFLYNLVKSFAIQYINYLPTITGTSRPLVGGGSGTPSWNLY